MFDSPGFSNTAVLPYSRITACPWVLSEVSRRGVPRAARGMHSGGR